LRKNKQLNKFPSSKTSALFFIELCHLSDHVAQLNDSKKREIPAEIGAKELQQLKRI